MLKRIAELIFIDEHGKWSHTKFWANIGNLIITYAFVHQVLLGTATTELYTMYGVIVIGNRTLNKFMQLKKDGTNVSS